MWKYVLAWFPMIFIAIANGFFREKFLVSRFNELQAHQISTVKYDCTGLVFMFGYYSRYGHQYQPIKQ